MTVSIMTQYDLIGKVEDVSDIITNISPTKTPFQSMIGEESIHQVTTQWQEDSLAAAGANAQIDSAAAPSASMTPTVMRSNNTQILSKTASVGGTADVTKTYGRTKELAYQISLKSAELKRDLEYALVGTTQAAVIGSTGAARHMASAQSLIDDSVTYVLGSGGGLSFGGGALPTAATITEAALLSVLQASYTAGGEPDTLMVKPADKVNVGNFQTNNRTVFVENGDKGITNTVDFYESPFGRLKVVVNRFIASSDALVFEASMWKKLVLRNWRRQTLAVTGDSTQVQIIGEFSLKHRNFFASGRLKNLA